MQLDTIPGRECGECNVCCVALTIDDPALQKVQGYRCKNSVAGQGCVIYETRPQTCRAFNCGWQMLKWVKPTMRPDRPRQGGDARGPAAGAQAGPLGQDRASSSQTASRHATGATKPA